MQAPKQPVAWFSIGLLAAIVLLLCGYFLGITTSSNSSQSPAPKPDVYQYRLWVTAGKSSQLPNGCQSAEVNIGTRYNSFKINRNVPIGALKDYLLPVGEYQIWIFCNQPHFALFRGELLVQDQSMGVDNIQTSCVSYARRQEFVVGSALTIIRLDPAPGTPPPTPASSCENGTIDIGPLNPTATGSVSITPTLPIIKGTVPTTLAKT